MRKACDRCGNTATPPHLTRFRENPGEQVREGMLCRICRNLVMPEYDIVIERRKEEDTSTASNPSTPFYTTRSWGFFDRNKGVYVEQIAKNEYLCSCNGRLSLEKVLWEPVPDSKFKKRPCLVVEGTRFLLPEKLFDVQKFYETPSQERCQEFIEGSWRPRPLPQIVEDLLLRIQALFEFTNDRDPLLWVLFTLQSYLKPVLTNFFFAGVDATKGGGKTTLLEIMAYVSRHGYLGGDVSAASLPRLVEELDLALFLDELDQRLGKGEEDSVSILRKGQRRGNFYVRLNKHTLLPEQFDVAGTHAFSFRSELEDAFMSRSLPMHTAESKDKSLPVVNIFKRQVLQSIREELFFWAMLEVPRISIAVWDVEDRLRGLVEGCSSVEGCRSVIRHHILRQQLYEEVLSDFTEEERTIFGSLAGRNLELCYLLLNISRLTKLDLKDTIKAGMQEKQEEEAFGEGLYLDALRDLLRLQYESLGDQWVLKEGETPGCKFSPKTSVYRALCQDLKENNIPTIGSKRYSSLLRDLGFIQGVSIRSQRPPNQSPKPCLIFTREVLKKLGIEELGASEEVAR